MICLYNIDAQIFTTLMLILMKLSLFLTQRVVSRPGGGPATGYKADPPAGYYGQDAPGPEDGEM